MRSSLLSPGEVVLDRYVVDRRVGAGGMGEVYRAQHQVLGTDVAIKVLSDGGSTTRLSRFFREAKATASIRHPNVTAILDIGTTGRGFPCLVLEYVDGLPLDEVLRRSGPLPWRRAVRLGLRILDGLAAVHSAGIVHRDLKPGNVMITASSDRPIPKLFDFGIATVEQRTPSDGRITREGMLVGTPAYMAPEQWCIGAPTDFRTDLYAFGLVLRELLTGRAAFDEHANVPLSAGEYPSLPPHLRAAASFFPVVVPADFPEVPADLERFLTTVLDRAPSGRPRDAVEAREALFRVHAANDATLANLDISPSPPVVWPALPTNSPTPPPVSVRATNLTARLPPLHGLPRPGEHRSGVHSRATTTDEDAHDPEAALPATFPPAPLHTPGDAATPWTRNGDATPRDRGTTKLPRGCHERTPARPGASGGQARDLRAEPTLPPVALRDAEAATLRNPRKGQSSMRRVPATLPSLPTQRQVEWLVFLAKIPATRLRSHDERKWLEARAGGRCRVFDGGLWSAEWPADRAPPLDALATALRTRFGDVRWTHAPLPAAPSPESFDGELPPQLAELVAHLR
jgi:serine/threonine-protein kinase